MKLFAVVVDYYNDSEKDVFVYKTRKEAEYKAIDEAAKAGEAGVFDDVGIDIVETSLEE